MALFLTSPPLLFALLDGQEVTKCVCVLSRISSGLKYYFISQETKTMSCLCHRLWLCSHHILRCILQWSDHKWAALGVDEESQYFTLDFLNLSRATWYVYLIATKDYSEFRLQKRLQGCLLCQIWLSKKIKSFINYYTCGDFSNSCPLIRRITHDACWCQTWPKLNFIEAVVHWDAINSALQLKICEFHPPLAISHSTSR